MMSLLLHFIYTFTLAKAVWLQPYFEDPHTFGVSFQNSIGVQTINVREELEWPFKLLKINYEGIGIPSLGSFEIGDNSLLGANITTVENEWFLYIDKRQDFENPHQRIYSFQIYIKDDAEALSEMGVLMTLENIFDNNPTVSYRPSPCRVEELQSDYLTNCVFSVYDPDGIDRNIIRLEVLSPNNEGEHFDFHEFGLVTTYEKQYQLKVKTPLHYEDRAIYNLAVKAYDASNNTGEIYAIIEVIDLPNRDPIWVRPLTTATFDEKQEQFFQLKAIDGDTGINKPICYRLEFEEDYSSLMSINEESGVLHVQPIDRDALNQQIFTFYTSAFKCDNSSWSIKNLTILIVQDINDNQPVISLNPEIVNIMESKYLTLPLKEFFIEDMDLGNNATYNVYLNSIKGFNHSQAFSLVPNSGYQQTNFSLNVIQTNEMDYENPQWREFEIIISAMEVNDVTHTTNRSLIVRLINCNDEWPLFTQNSYEAFVSENVSSGYVLQKVYATDRDIDDEVVHTIVGSMDGLYIDPSTGVITTTEDHVFDYERQSVVLLQIQAKDQLITEESSELHTSYAQLMIHVADVNDEVPEMRMPRSIVNITENSEAFTLVTDKIEARDSDTTANLTFEILWDLSYATKSGQEALKDDFMGCFLIETRKENTNLVFGLLRVNPLFDKKVDYEKYDTIFLTVKVTDMKQEINENSSTAVLTVRIDDVNDNPPLFAVGSLEEPRKVNEMDELGTVIGSIEAFDVDGPLHNIISFGLRPLDNLTTDGLITIHNTTGVIRVNAYIQCDVPKVFQLLYEILLTDGIHITTGQINISIVDINNQAPVTDSFEQQVAIYENARSGVFVGRIQAHDDDRDAPHNILEFSLNSASVVNLHNLFQINISSGEIFVNLRNDLVLDRDNGVTFYYIPVDVKDNFNFDKPGYGPVNQRSTFLNVTLLDVNDNAPIMPLPSSYAPEFSETDFKDTFSKLELEAIDLDEAHTENSRISYRILSIQPGRNNSKALSDYSELFSIGSTNVNVGKLKAENNLRGFYGVWLVEIEAFDHGEPALSNSSVYEVYVRPHNFHNPTIVYPIANKSIRVCYALQEANRPLYQADCITRLSMFESQDADGGDYGDVVFHLSSDSGDAKYFQIVKENRHQSHLYLKEPVPAGVYTVNLRASDGGGSSSEEMRNLKIVFVDVLGNPMFMERTFETNFTENEQGMVEKRYIPAAYDPKNEGLNDDDEQYKLYYLIDDSTDPTDAELFNLDPVTRLLQLRSPLDRELQGVHRLFVKVSNNENSLFANPNSVNNLMEILITVSDVNDNAPIFSQDYYAAGLTLKDAIGKEIIVLQASDADLNDSLSYEIITDSLQAFGAELNEAKGKMFKLNGETGSLSLDTYVRNGMKGYFMFNISVDDSAVPPHSDMASVKIYIVSEANRVKFVFLSNIQSIRDNDKFIREEFQQIYGYDICNIDDVEDVTNQQKQITRQETIGGAFITDVVVHFIHNNEAVEARDIQRRSTDLAFVSKLQNSLQRRNLLLNAVPHMATNDEQVLVENWIVTILIVLCSLFAILCAIITVVFIFKMRAMKRQLKAFEPPEFGSIASNLNRLGGPTTNVFSVEGSNPVMHNQSNAAKIKCGVYDAECTSSESEEDDEYAFEGIQEDPIFDVNAREHYENIEKGKVNETKILNNHFFENATKSEEDNLRF